MYLGLDPFLSNIQTVSINFTPVQNSTANSTSGTPPNVAAKVAPTEGNFYLHAFCFILPITMVIYNKVMSSLYSIDELFKVKCLKYAVIIAYLGVIIAA